MEQSPYQTFGREPIIQIAALLRSAPPSPQGSHMASPSTLVSWSVEYVLVISSTEM